MQDTRLLRRDKAYWLHVDGAYGAVGTLDPDLAPRYVGLSRADSLALDPHKWLSVPVECGAVIVRDGQRLHDAFSLVPPYLRTEEGKGFGVCRRSPSTASSRRADFAEAVDGHAADGSRPSAEPRR